VRENEKKTILVASLDPALADVRKHVLEAAGYRVVVAMNIEEVINGFRDETIDLVMIGYSLPPAEKRRVWAHARDCGEIPVLELSKSGTSELLDETRTHTHHAQTPEDFLEAVRSILET
jgi:DNA-binding response OmpR family regulator